MTRTTNAGRLLLSVLTTTLLLQVKALVATANAEPEGIFLGEGTNFFLVTLTNDQAQLKRIAGLEFIPEPLGASPAAGGEVFMLSSTGMVSFNLLTSNLVTTAITLPPYAVISQGDVGTNGWFYFTDSVSNDLWALDWRVDTPAAKRVGPLLTAAGLSVQVQGGDCGFAADGTLCLWSNWPENDAAPRGLYQFQIPALENWPTNVVAFFEPCHAVLTGMAVSKMGEQSIIGATWPDSTIIQFGSSNAQVTGTFPLTLDGLPYTHSGGDMAVGVYSNDSPTESLFLGEGTNLFLVTLTNSPSKRAELTPVPGFSSEVGLLGASPAVAGQVFSLSSAGLISFNLVTRACTTNLVTFPPGVSCTQADVGTNGWFYFTDSISNNLWAIDPTQEPLEAKMAGCLMTADGLPVGLHGADIGFASNGTLYVWSNWAQSSGAPRGLYAFRVPTDNWPTNIAALVEPAHLIVTGLAVSKTGQPTVVASTWISTIAKIDPGNGQVISTVPVYLDGLPYSHSSGDMAIAVSTNGTPFDWLQAFGLGADGWNRDAMADQDSDGMPAWQEYIAGTDPTNPVSGLSIVDVLAPSTQSATGSWFVITWPSVSNRYYDLDRTTSLATDGFVPIASGLPATPPVNVYTDAVEYLEGAMYRIRVYLK